MVERFKSLAHSMNVHLIVREGEERKENVCSIIIFVQSGHLFWKRDKKDGVIATLFLGEFMKEGPNDTLHRLRRV